MSQKKSFSPDQQPTPAQNLPAASLLKLLATLLYDSMLLSAVWLLAGIVYMIPAQLIVKMNSASKNDLSTTEFTGPVFYIYLFIISWFFFAWFWVHGGQTLGLRTWSLRLQTRDGYAINWTQSLLRFLIAGTPWLAALFVYGQLLKTQLLSPPYLYGTFLIGFSGIFWVLIDKEKRSLQDIFSGTRIVQIPKRKS